MKQESSYVPPSGWRELNTHLHKGSSVDCEPWKKLVENIRNSNLILIKSNKERDWRFSFPRFRENVYLRKSNICFRNSVQFHKIDTWNQYRRGP